MSTTTTEAPTLWTFTYLPPGAQHTRTLDCYAATLADAVKSARRFIAGQNRLLARAGITRRIRTPQPHHMVNETARAAAKKEA